MTATKTERLGGSGPAVFPIALGCMGMGAGAWYGDSDEAESIATIHAAVERGVNLEGVALFVTEWGITSMDQGILAQGRYCMLEVEVTAKARLQ